MAVNIVTGRTGSEHITSDDERMRNAEIYGDGKFVFDCGESHRRFLAVKLDERTVKITSGMCMSYGTQMGIEPYDEVTVSLDAGTLGYKRHDFIVMKYRRDRANDTESAELAVVKGDPVQDNPLDPTSKLVTGNILKGETEDDTPLFRVVFDGQNIKQIDAVYRLRDGTTPTSSSDPSAPTVVDPTVPGGGGEAGGTTSMVITPEIIDALWGSGIEDGDAQGW